MKSFILFLTLKQILLTSKSLKVVMIFFSGVDLQNFPDINRLMWFTHGFYKVILSGHDIRLADLRMGVEPGYIFQFKVAEMSANGSLYPIHPKRVFMQPNIEDLPKLWQRIVHGAKLSERHSGEFD